MTRVLNNQGHITKSSGPHSHGADRSAVEELLFRQNVRETVLDNPEQNAKQVFNDCQEQFQLAAETIPFSNTRSLIYNTKNRMSHVYQEPC